jgi:hypothetical protein
MLSPNAMNLVFWIVCGDLTVTANVHEAWAASASVAVHFTVCSPMGNTPEPGSH